MKSLPLFFLLLALVVVTAGCGQKPVANASSEDEANEMIDVLRENGFEADKEEVSSADGGERKEWRVMVETGWLGGSGVAPAVRVLRDNGLPRPVDKGFEGAYDEKGMFPSESAQRAQRMKELKTEIERQLRLIPGVTRANVIIVPPEDKSFAFEKYEPTASVVVVRKDQSPPISEAEVQQLVARGVPSLKPENVSVRISTQATRPVPRRDLEVQQRNKLLIAGGTGLFVMLGAVLIVMLVQSRQQRRTIAALRADAAANTTASEGYDEETEDGYTQTMLTGAGNAPTAQSDKRWLEGETDAAQNTTTNTATRLLPAGSNGREGGNANGR